MARFRRRQQCCEMNDDSLTCLRHGQKAEVAAVTAGCKARPRLASLGIVPGVVCSVLACAGAGPMLLSIEDTRLMLERGVADNVQIRQLP